MEIAFCILRGNECYGDLANLKSVVERQLCEKYKFIYTFIFIRLKLYFAFRKMFRDLMVFRGDFKFYFIWKRFWRYI